MSKRVIAYPWRGIAYTECFYAAVKSLGAEVLDGEWSGRWILANIRAGDIVHLHWPSFQYEQRTALLGRGPAILRFVLFLLIMRARGARLVWTAHNLYPHDGGRADPVHRFARHVLTALAGRVLAHGEHAARLVSNEFRVPARKVRIIQHGNWIGYYPATLTRQEARARLGIPADKYVFGFVGLCKPYKNLESLIAAFAALDSNAILLIAGKFQSAEYRARIEQTLASLDPSRVVFRPGFIQDDEIQVYLKSADILVLPYTDILTSGSTMLAFSFGLPVIAAGLEAMRATVNEVCGVLYEPREFGALTQAMRHALARRFDAGLIEHHACSFNWANSAETLLSD